MKNYVQVSKKLQRCYILVVMATFLLELHWFYVSTRGHCVSLYSPLRAQTGPFSTGQKVKKSCKYKPFFFYEASVAFPNLQETNMKSFG